MYNIHIQMYSRICGVPEGKYVRNIINNFDSEYYADVHG